jgi:hypothetical protein
MLFCLLIFHLFMLGRYHLNPKGSKYKKRERNSDRGALGSEA